MELVRGYRGKILNDEITVDMNVSGNSVYDFSCFGVDVDDKLTDDRYMIFYNQPSSPEGEITYSPYDNGAKFAVSLSKLPSKIAKLVFTVSIDGAGTMGEISTHTLIISAGSEAMTMKLSGGDFQNERAIISIEIYRKDGWRVSAVAAGFDGGLRELLKRYGGHTRRNHHQLELEQGQRTQAPNDCFFRQERSY